MRDAHLQFRIFADSTHGNPRRNIQCLKYFAYNDTSVRAPYFISNADKSLSLTLFIVGVDVDDVVEGVLYELKVHPHHVTHAAHRVGYVSHGAGRRVDHPRDTLVEHLSYTVR